MKVHFAKSFIKQSIKCSGTTKKLLDAAILGIENATSIAEIRNCKKLTDYKNAYRIRIGDYRAIFLFIVIDDMVYFQYFLHRGEAYNKEYLKNIE